MIPKPKHLKYSQGRAIRLSLVTRNFRRKKEQNNFGKFSKFGINQIKRQLIYIKS